MFNYQTISNSAEIFRLLVQKINKEKWRSGKFAVKLVSSDKKSQKLADDKMQSVQTYKQLLNYRLRGKICRVTIV